MVEGLAKKIGYNKVRAFTTSRDTAALRDFVNKTAMKVKITISPEKFRENNIEAVPVTIIETTDGKKVRHEGMTENLTDASNPVNSIQIDNVQNNNQLLPAGQTGQKCNSGR